MKLISTRLARKLRVKAIKLTTKYKASHIGSILSVVDIMSVLFSSVIKRDGDELFDRFVLSKGHAGLALYLILEQLGLANKNFAKEYYKSADKTTRRPRGVDFLSSSLGQGIGVAIGMALAAKLDNSGREVYTIIGNGEMNEGSVYEALLLAASNSLDNLTIIIDQNNMQAMGNSKNILNGFDICALLKSMNLEVIDIDGHDHNKLLNAFNAPHNNKAKVIIAKTTKGKRVSFMENNPKYHYGYVKNRLLKRAIDEAARL